jgi:hypothetical protein
MRKPSIIMLLFLSCVLAACTAEPTATATATPSRTSIPPSATTEFRLIPSWTPTLSPPPSATATPRPTATPDLTLRPYFTAQPNYTPLSGQGIATPDLVNSLPWLDRFSFASEEQPVLLFDLPYDPAAWRLETAYTPGGSGYQLVHRGISGCVLSQTTGGNASEEMTVEYTDETIGDSSYYIGQATEEDELVFVTYCTSYADMPTCFIAYPGASERRCLAEVEGMLASINFITNPRYTNAPNLWACRDEQNNPGLCQISFTQPLYAFSLPVDGAAWAVGEDGMILRQEGTEWVRIDSPATSELYDIVFLDETHGWAAGLNGTILSWDGTEWAIDFSYTPPRNDPDEVDRFIYALDYFAPDVAWAAGAIVFMDGHVEPLLLSWNGMRWLVRTDIPACESCGINAVLTVNKSEVWVAGGGETCQGDEGDECLESAMLWHWDGSTWETFSLTGASWLYALAQCPSGELWAAGTEYVVTAANAEPQSRAAVFGFNGTEWDRFSLPPNSGGIYALATLGDGSLVVGGDVTLLRSGHTWSYIATEIAGYGEIIDLEIGSDGRLFALTSSGFLFTLQGAVR